MKVALRLTYLLGAFFALTAQAGAAEIQPPHEEVTIGAFAPGDFYVYAVLHPLQGVAVLGAQTSPARIGGGKWSSTSYAIHVQRQALKHRLRRRFWVAGED